MLCKRCGAEVGDANFCPSCGAQVARAESENPYAVGTQFQTVGPVADAADAPELPGFFRAYGMFWEKFASVKGRASRREFWFVVIWQLIVAFALFFLSFGLLFADARPLVGSVYAQEEIVEEETTPREDDEDEEFVNYGPFFGLELFIPIIFIGILYLLTNFIPFLCLVVRRLHDANVSGWAALLLFIPFLIPFLGRFWRTLLLIVGLLPPTKGPNKYGPAPTKRVNA
ncbi:MAG: DUF805 domain-containing protein [Thermoguttaceae bacterium]|nr:DUF805 domain-containing protein [Thermoguttaceae bacterium]